MSEPKINIGNSQKDKVDTRKLKIAKNVFIYDDTFIPLHNICRVSVFQEAEKMYSMKVSFAMVIGFLLLFFDGIFTFTGAAIMLVSGYILYSTYKFNQELGQYLKIELNSGKNLYFYNKNKDFLVEVMDVMINCLNTDKEYLISMDTYNIESCQFGNHNLMKNGEEDSE